MDINRNQFFMFGVLVLMLGIQFRVVDSYVLNEEATRFLAKRTGAVEETPSQSMIFLTSSTTGPKLVKKRVTLPEWTGWCLISIGSVLVLHSLALKRPD